ncbi:helix-turn-helix domain-containing protein [Haliscomenobacter sp.]|uniref:helix-turn-helix domain-containing protein n=1 Tax=Haliscomenobacter sp. TaxID=2717303 RepID=UPI003BABA884
MAMLFVKNMVCNRCKMVLRTELAKLGVEPIRIDLGEVQLETELSTAQKQTLSQNLQVLGFELIDDKKSRVIERIKTIIIELVHQQNSALSKNLSVYLTEALHYEYSYLSNLFTAVEGTTIEQYFITQKIERVKELLVYDELSLNEIAYQLNYSSVAHLSNQFKKITGLTPSHFRQLKDKKRKALDEL